MRTIAILLLTGMITAAVPAAAQTPGEASVYKVEFNIHDGSDAAANTARRYTLLIEGNSKGYFRAGNKVPYQTSAPPAGQTPTYNYADVGVNIEARLQTTPRGVSLSADFEVSSVLPREGTAGPVSPNPIIASRRIQVNTVMVPGKPTVVASIDDPATRRRFDVEVTITKAE
jgi:hypothetical protein